METVKKMGEGWDDEAEDLGDPLNQPERRTVTIEEGGYTFYLSPRDPYGFWYAKPKTGVLPKVLQQAWTAIDLAERAIRNYIAANPQAPAKVEAQEKGTTPPELKRKPVKKKKEEQEDSLFKAP